MWTCVLCGRVWRGGRSAREPRGSHGAFTFRRPVLHPGPPWHVDLHSRVEAIPPTEARAHKPGGLHRTETHPAARAGSSAGTREVCGRQQGASHLEPAMAMAMEAGIHAPSCHTGRHCWSKRDQPVEVQQRLQQLTRRSTGGASRRAVLLHTPRELHTRPYTSAPRWGNFGLLGPPEGAPQDWRRCEVNTAFTELLH